MHSDRSECARKLDQNWKNRLIQYLLTGWICVLLFVAEATAADYFVDAGIAGSVDSAPGTQDSTEVDGQGWKSLDLLLASGKVSGGDRIFLRQGHHGPLMLKGMRFPKPVLVTSAPGQSAQVESINVRDSSNIAFDRLAVWPTSATANKDALVRSYPDTSDLIFRDLDVRGNKSARNYMDWDLVDWLSNKRNGILVDGNRISVVNNHLAGIRHGISSLGTNALVENNTVDGFSGDGMRALGDNSIVRGNQVRNCVKIDANHDDGFQSFTRTGNKAGIGLLKNLLIENNRIFEWSSPRKNALRCRLQGISLFDGMYDGVTIRNNVVAVSAYHGITVAGALNSAIVNNTVVEANGVPGKSPWIGVFRHKDGTPSFNVTVANNLVTRMSARTNVQQKILVTNNVIVTSVFREFVSFPDGDFALGPQALGVDRGDMKFAPPTDIVGVTRPQGKAPDAGAYESR